MSSENEQSLGQVNPLVEIVKARIKENGPITFEEYMDVSLNGAVDASGIHIPGFYNGHPNISVEDTSDFDTAPERSPMFGFMLARQIHEMQERLGEKDFTVVEMGGGNGTMARDVLVASKHFYPHFQVNYVILENSPYLAEKQRERLKDFDVKVIEGSALDRMPEGIVGLVLSNELFDDLPTKVIRQIHGVWEELYIAEKEGSLQMHWDSPTTEAYGYVDRNQPQTEHGYPTAASLNGEKLMRKIGRNLIRGFVLTVDYDMKPKGTPFMVYPTLANEVKINFLDHQYFGKTNLTACVDFDALIKAGERGGLILEKDLPSRTFFEGLGYSSVRDYFAGMFQHRYTELVGLVARDPKQRDYSHGTDRAFKREADEAILGFSHRVLIQSKGV